MCCALRIDLGESDLGALAALLYELWGRPKYQLFGRANWQEPPRAVIGSSVWVRMEGSGHAVTSESWLVAVKYAAGFYEEARRRELKPMLSHVGDPCNTRVVGDGGELNLASLCRVGLLSRVTIQRSPHHVV